MALAALVMAVVPAAPGRAALPPCPNGADVVFTYPPDFLRAGASLSFTIERTRARAVADVQVRFPGPEGIQTEVFAFPEGRNRIRVIRPAPEGKRFGMRFAWVQNADQENACVGLDVYTGIPIVARRARVGRPGTARFAGRYQLRVGGKPVVRWRARPACVVFGCRTRVRSSSGVRLSFIPRGLKRYDASRRVRAGACTVTYADGRKDVYGIYFYQRIALRVVRRRRDGLALRLVGRHLSHYAAPRDRFGVCDFARRQRNDRLRVTRLGP